MKDPSHRVSAVDGRYLTSRSSDEKLLPQEFSSLEAWLERRARVREHIATVCGLLPMPDLVPRSVSIMPGPVGPGYRVDRVALIGAGGLLCTGNLYRPENLPAPAPVILNPHGHWERGRLEHSSMASVRARCIAFARMGMLAFSYDMVGYNDSLQIPDHHFRSRHGALWGLTSLILQTWNSLMALEFCAGLEEVDPARIGCTGASGGASQALLLSALDERITALAPVNMISAHFQGGCECENTPGLRIDTGNVEIAALSAPRPMLMVSATGDWTCNTPQVEYPALRHIYELYGCPEHLAQVQIDADHNYNAQSRASVYRWFAQWFGASGDEDSWEADVPLEPDSRLRVFPAGELPPEVPNARQLPRVWRAYQVQRQARLWPSSARELDQLAITARQRLVHTLGLQSTSSPDEPAWEIGYEARTDGLLTRRLALGRSVLQERIECLACMPHAAPTGGVILVDEAGPEAYLDELGQPGPLMHSLGSMGVAVYVAIPFGWSVPSGAVARRDRDWFWSCFNRPFVAEQVQDILVLVSLLRSWHSELALIGRGQGGVWALLAAALTANPTALCVDLTDVDLDQDDVYLRHLDVPLARCYDLCSMAEVAMAPTAQLCAARASWSGLGWARRAYGLADAQTALKVLDRPLSDEDILEWLVSTTWTGRYLP